MAKKKQTDEEINDVENLSTPEEVSHETKKVADPSHLEPQKESTELPSRPKAVDQSHLKPMEEVKPEKAKKVKVADPKHLKPQE